MIIEADRLRLIRQEEPDADIDEILHDPGILENLSEARSYPSPMPSSICFKIESNNRTIGQACLKSIKWINHKAEISMFIKKDMQSKGHGKSVLKAIIKYGFKRLNLYRLEAEVIDNNKRSIALLEKFGFKEEGRLREAKYVNGEYCDLLRFGLLRHESDE